MLHKTNPVYLKKRSIANNNFFLTKLNLIPFKLYTINYY